MRMPVEGEIAYRFNTHRTAPRLTAAQLLSPNPLSDSPESRLPGAGRRRWLQSSRPGAGAVQRGTADEAVWMQHAPCWVSCATHQVPMRRKRILRSSPRRWSSKLMLASHPRYGWVECQCTCNLNPRAPPPRQATAWKRSAHAAEMI